MTDPPKAIGYVRVSTAGQAADGVSLQAQESAIRNWCEQAGRTLERVCVENGVSGSRADNRPALQQALAQVCDTKGVLVVYSLARLARSTYDTIEIAEQLKAAGADLVSLSEDINTTTAAGKMVFRLLAVLAEFERDLISERTKASLAWKRAHGEMTGSVRYGFRGVPSDKTTKRGTRIVHEVPDEGEQKVIHQMAKMRKAGIGYHRIAKALDANEIPTRHGGKWRAATVRKILLREKGGA